MKEKTTGANRAIDRLREFMTAQGLKDSPFEKKVGLSNGYMNKSAIGSGSIGSDILYKIHVAFPDLSLNWLITGVEDKKAYKPQETGIISQEPTIIYLPNQADDNLIKMPVMDMRFAAGASSYGPDQLEVADYVSIPRTWVKKGKNYACGRVRGDSMAPTLLDGGYAIIRLLEKGEWKNMPNEEIYVVVTKESQFANMQVKRVKNRLSQGFLVMMSDNPDKATNPNFNIYTEEIISIWHMDWYFTSRMPNIHNQYYSRLQALEDKIDDLLNDIKPTVRIKKQVN